MIGQDELKKQQEYQELDLLKKFYDFACQCKSKENKGDKHEVEFDCGSSGKLKFSYDKSNVNLIPTDNINNIDLTSQPIFCCIGGFFVMFSQGKDGNTNVYALNDNCINKIDNNFNDINANIQGINPYVFKIKNVPIGNAKKFLSSSVDNTEPEDVNDYVKQVKNELDFKCVFSKIVNNNNEDDIEDDIKTIVVKNHKQLDVIKNIRDRYNNVIKNIRDGYNKIYQNNGKQISFKGFDDEDVKLYYNIITGSVSNDWQKLQLEQNAYYFGKHGLLMAITKSNNGKVNVFATNANMKCGNPDGGNDKYAGLFAVYDASQEDAEIFIQKLNQYNIDKTKYTNIDNQEKFEQFFQDHCKQNIKIEKDDGKSNVCCWGLFNCCGASKAK